MTIRSNLQEQVNLVGRLLLVALPQEKIVKRKDWTEVRQFIGANQAATPEEIATRFKIKDRKIVYQLRTQVALAIKKGTFVPIVNQPAQIPLGKSTDIHVNGESVSIENALGKVEVTPKGVSFSIGGKQSKVIPFELLKSLSEL